METRELEPVDGGGPWTWVALGCGGLLLVGLCLVPPAFLFLDWDDEETLADPAIDPNPNPDPNPSQNPLPPPPPNPGLNQPPTPGVAPPPGTVTSTRTVTVRLDAVEGSGISHLRVGSDCTFPVRQVPQPDGTFWCNAEIRCGGELLYGGGQAGFFDCTLYEQPQRHVVGHDRSTTSVDRDAAMSLDTLAAELVVSDDATGEHGAFTLRATVTAVQ